MSTQPENINNKRNEPALINSIAHIEQSFHYWYGASGKRYLHTVYSLTNCPIMPRANYIMVKRYPCGTAKALRISKTTEKSCSLNLAHLRQRAAQLGANEIHIHALTETQKDRNLVEMDLRAGLFSKMTAEA